MNSASFFHLLVDAQTLARHLDDPSWVLVDCRFELTAPEAGERNYRLEHLPKARYAHLERDLSGPATPTSGRHPLPDPVLLAEKLSSWGISTTTQVVVYDEGPGAFAARLWWLLRWLGHERVAVLDGGLKGWQQQGFALTPEIPEITAATFEAKLQENQWISGAALVVALADQSIHLLDARGADRFQGQNETLDPKAGHVRGAINRPFMQNLRDGYFKSPTELRADFTALLGGVPSQPLVSMCGSGVTACHNLLALELAGLTGMRLYPGSWSEWCKHSEWPMTVF